MKWKKEQEMLRNHPLRKVPLDEIARRYLAAHPGWDFTATYKKYQEFVAPKALVTAP
jgi:hypothetical protein